MRIGLLVSSIGAFGKKGFYNAQEIGLAKALSSIVDEVKVYKLVSINEREITEKVIGTNNAMITYLPSKKIGNNGNVNTKKLDTQLDALIYFADTQFSVNKVYTWAKKYKVALFPYIGVIESHSNNQVKKIIVDLFFKRNTSVYKKLLCFAKTNTVKEKMVSIGINQVEVMPVGLDFSLLKKDYQLCDINLLRKKYGVGSDDIVILFVGRLTPEKQPIEMINIFNKLSKINSRYKLMMIGTGELKKQVEEKIQEYNLDNRVINIDKINNNDIWELYCLANYFINLNKQEIFGMAVLEAMYYECKVIAFKAPGPGMIIEDGRSGKLVETEDEIINILEDGNNYFANSQERVLRCFLWDSIAKNMMKMIESYLKLRK